MKKVIIAVISLTLALCLLVPLFSAAGETCPYVDANGTYYRLSFGKPLDFKTDFDEMTDYFLQEMKERNPSISYRFATTDTTYQYEKSSALDNSAEASDKLFNDLLYAVFTKNSASPSNANGGDYLYRSIKEITTHYCTTYSSVHDNPIGDNPRYYTFEIILDIDYYSTAEQESVISQMCKDFSENFISPNATEYEKVKTIYDFVVRNTDYDWDVYDGKYTKSSKRYNIAHSAYGALIGGVAEGANYDFTSEQTIADLTVISNANQGLSVCEGYSKLFYYLCVMNGIPCRIVDGDYTSDSGKDSDPHEWNHVYLDDGTGDGYKWFMVDTTFAAQNSYKEINLCDYDYFLAGLENSHFADSEHQQPYHKTSNDIVDALVIYDFYGETGDSSNCPSLTDYALPLINISNVDALKNGYIVRRRTVYPGESVVKTALVYANSDDQNVININEDGVITTIDVHGFRYNGQTSSVYDVVLPYLDTREYTCDMLTGVKDAGDYSITIHGAGDSSASVGFKIIQLNLDNSNEENYDVINVQRTYPFTGGVITPRANIVDGHNNLLTNGVDYDIVAYSDPEHTQTATISNIGTYYIDVAYKGNYSGHYYFTFNVEKLDMSYINMSTMVFPYYPEPFLNQQNIFSPADYYASGAKNMTLGNYTVKAGEDFSVTSTGTLEWGSTGTITLTGLPTSEVLKEGSSVTFPYSMTGTQFDLSSKLNLTWADTRYHIYTGSAVEPETFDYVDQFLIRGVDYEVASYSNNTRVGVATVTIRGINGCTGTKTLQFAIQRNAGSLKHSDKTAHNYVPTVVSPTCTDKGRTIYTCSACSLSYFENYTEPLGHNYVSEVISPTCQEQGYTKTYCTRCGEYTLSDYVAMTGHNYIPTVASATPNEQGFTRYCCQYCNDYYDTDFTPYASDSTALIEAIQEAENYSGSHYEYTAESIEDLIELAESYIWLAGTNAPQNEYDSAATEIMQAINSLELISDYVIYSFDGSIATLINNSNGKTTTIHFSDYIGGYCAPLDVVSDGKIDARDYGYLLKNYYKAE